MSLVTKEENYTRYGITYQAPEQPGLIWYCFKVVTNNNETFFYGNNEQHAGGEGVVSKVVPPYFQLTVYGTEQLPSERFYGKVMYQIFVDRFFNGNENNQVTNPKKNSLLHSHWDNDPFYIREENGDIRYWDFFGGNIKGIIKKLPYLSELGVDILYLNPIFEAPSNHKYDTADYHKLDAMFGDEADFLQLCSEAKKLGMSIILDGVFSHTGSDSLYFNKEGKYPTIGAYQSKESPYYSWYQFHQFPDEYECWWGIDTLPNVNELHPSYMDFLIHGQESVLNYWQKFGIVGWRLDVADELPDEFIRQFKQRLLENNPHSLLIGEVWEDASNKISYGKRRKYLLGNELDSVTNYPFRETAIAFILEKISAQEVHIQFMRLYENYPKAHFFNLMNIIGTHDTPRILSLLSNDEETMKRMKMMVCWQLLFPGIPCIYYGDEAGLEGVEEPLNRRTYPWGHENLELLEWYKKIIKIRKQYNVFQTGEWTSFSSGEDVYYFIREDNETMAIVLLNRSNNEQEVRIENVKGTFYYVIQEKNINLEKQFMLRSLESMVLIHHK